MSTLKEEELLERAMSISEVKASRLLIIDSSFLMLPVSGKPPRINIEDALFSISEGRKLVVLDVTVHELFILLKKAKGKKHLAADFAIRLIERLRLPIIRVPEEIKKKVLEKAKTSSGWEVTDEILAEAAKELGAAVATTDLELKRKLEKIGVPVYYLRGKKWIYSSRKE